MSAPSAPTTLGVAILGKLTGRLNVRWSVASPKLLPVSIAGLVLASAIVWVPPPLLASGPSWGLTPIRSDPGVVSLFVAPELFWIRLKAESKVPLRSGADGALLPAMIESARKALGVVGL